MKRRHRDSGILSDRDTVDRALADSGRGLPAWSAFLLRSVNHRVIIIYVPILSLRSPHKYQSDINLVHNMHQEGI